MIHNSCALVGWRSALMAGTARCRTVRSITYSTHASAITASPIHSLRPARGGAAIWFSACTAHLQPFGFFFYDPWGRQGSSVSRPGRPLELFAVMVDPAGPPTPGADVSRQVRA